MGCTVARVMCAANPDASTRRAAHPLFAVLVSQERSASWLGRKTGKSDSYVLRVMDGSRRASDDFRVRAAQALGVPASLLFPEEAAA